VPPAHPVDPTFVAGFKSSLTAFQHASFAVTGEAFRMYPAGHDQHSPPFCGSKNDPLGQLFEGALPRKSAGSPTNEHPFTSLGPASMIGQISVPCGCRVEGGPM
jgi:hypothetical protein